MIPPPLLSIFFFFNYTATPEIYPLSLHDALPILRLLGIGDIMHGIRGEQAVGRKQARRVDVVASEQQKIGFPIIVESSQRGAVARAVRLGGAEIERSLTKAWCRRPVVRPDQQYRVRIDQAGRNPVARERLAGGRIVDRAATRKVSADLGFGRNRGRTSPGVLLNATVFARHEEEQLVLDNRPT